MRADEDGVAAAGAAFEDRVDARGGADCAGVPKSALEDGIDARPGDGCAAMVELPLNGGADTRAGEDGVPPRGRAVVGIVGARSRIVELAGAVVRAPFACRSGRTGGGLAPARNFGSGLSAVRNLGSDLSPLRAAAARKRDAARSLPSGGGLESVTAEYPLSQGACSTMPVSRPSAGKCSHILGRLPSETMRARAFCEFGASAEQIWRKGG
jgi:hypothetical protein